MRDGLSLVCDFCKGNKKGCFCVLSARTLMLLPREIHVISQRDCLRNLLACMILTNIKPDCRFRRGGAAAKRALHIFTALHRMESGLGSRVRHFWLDAFFRRILRAPDLVTADEKVVLGSFGTLTRRPRLSIHIPSSLYGY